MYLTLTEMEWLARCQGHIPALWKQFGGCEGAVNIGYRQLVIAWRQGSSVGGWGCIREDFIRDLENLLSPSARWVLENGTQVCQAWC